MASGTTQSDPELHECNSQHRIYFLVGPDGGLVVESRALGARFTYPERQAEGPAYLRWLSQAGLKSAVEAVRVNEGEGDFLVVGGKTILAGTGFRTDPRAHTEVQELFGVPVISLTLVDPRYHHLDTALAVLDDSNVAYFQAPPAKEVARCCSGCSRTPCSPVPRTPPFLA